MENATPKEAIDTSIPKDKEGRISRLKKINKKQLEEAIVLLNQLKRAGAGLYKIKENDIHGLDSIDITYTLLTINPIYQEEKNAIPNEKYVETIEKIKDGNKIKKIRMKLYGDVEGCPVFFFSGFNESTGRFPERTFMIGPKFNLALNEIIEVLNKKKNEKTSLKIKNLKNPVRWEDITFIFNVNSIKIKQDSTILGKYTIKELGIPKLRKNQKNGIYPFLTSLFFPEHYKDSKILIVKNITNQKNKSNLSKILKKVFETNKDPISINKKTQKYIPIFQISLGDDYRINDHPSGRKLYNKDGAILDDFTEQNLY